MFSLRRDGFDSPCIVQVLVSCALMSMYPIQHARSNTQQPYHSLVWISWLIAALVAVTHNPLLNLLVMAQATLVALTCHTDGPVGRAFGLFLRLGLILLVARMIFAAIPIGGVSYGATPLITLPEIALPIWLGGLRLGGVATLEMVVNGLVSGVRLWTLILVFGAFNAVVDHYSLLRRTPRWLFHAGLATTIALTFVPQVILQFQAIRDAQRARGYRFRAWRDALPLLVPLLSGGLERSIQLAEAMDSRGYGRASAPAHSVWLSQLAVIAGATILALGLYFGLTGAWLGWPAALAGGALAIGVLHRLGGNAPRTRYTRERWQRRDTLVALACAAVIFGMTALRLAGVGGLLYTALPRVSLPPFEPISGALLLLLCAPAALQLVKIRMTHERRPYVQPSRLADRV